jgi:hypothetical protein
MKEINIDSVKFLPITKLEKENLKNRIFNSINKSKSLNRKVKYTLMGIAVSVTIIISLSLVFYNKPKESITDFVNSLETLSNTNDDVTLILGEGQNLKIDEKVTSINYSNSGEEVTIGSSHTVTQQTSKNNKLVYNTLLVPYGKRSKIKLSDGSIVWLNSGSRLIYPIAFNGKKREIYLEGEAIFEVAHNIKKPFIVVSQNQEVEVFGTVFGITCYLDENSINTVLKSGSVQISYNNSSSILDMKKIKIIPGTKAIYDKKNKNIILEKVNADNHFAWRDGALFFKNNDIMFIMKKLTRYYNIEIEISKEVLANESETYSGYLDLNEDVEKVIKIMQESTNVNYTFKEKIIIN